MSALEIPADAYHRDEVADVPTLSASIATILVTKSPAHAYAAHPKLNPNYQRDDDDDKFALGTTSHALLLEGLEIADVFDFKDWRTDAAKAARAEARAAGRVPLLRPQWDRVTEM